MSIYLRLFLQFWAFIGLQVALLNKIHLRWWAQPMGFPIFVPQLYPLLILLLPFNTPRWVQLILGFALGLTIDLCSNTAGMHALATTIIAYYRQPILLAVLPKRIEEYGGQIPSVRNMSWAPYLTYAAILISIHHLVYFIIEFWSFANVWQRLLKFIASTTTTLLMVVIYCLLFTKNIGIKARSSQSKR